ncbi:MULTISPECIES: glycosyltransferase [unclassified Rhizobium]|uniref:glycosyltransferase n=1 Tax=unclassified Rhizobium TaxID=2613769 RepID=UPI0007162645|nr:MULTISPECIES: glycosyltransferase [unclassified Rhizobium]KQS99087.1 lipopolysaccharide biosynthesis protein [Rhizobium sp. Leaf386]KQT05439.1 lipopolysaccharide biosynthesis protein [Rhizobium sp. Leaf391]KQT91881.1 lipopolysaccharide biosynthesis protein [Rhizobium sp. Leaf453]
MKVMHYHFGKEGGAERFFVNLVNALHDRGVEQRMLIRPDRSWRKDIEGCGVVYEGIFRRLSLSRFLLRARMQSVLKEFQPDVIMAWQLRASRFMPAWKHSFRLSRLGDYPEHLGYYKNVQMLVCITPDMAARVREMGWTGPIEVISNFTRAQPLPAIARNELQTPDNAFVVTGMGRFVPRKGFDYLIRAVARVPGTYLWLLGDGPERDNLIKLVSDLGVGDRVRLPGWKTNAYSYLAAADSFAISSLHEPLGNVCFEGWGSGKPTIAARAEGPSWVMTDDVDALLVDCADEIGLAAAIERLRDDPALRQRLIENASGTLRTRFSEDAIATQYIELFERERPSR